MKDCLFAIYYAVKENLYWLILALAFGLMFWLAPKVKAAPLEDYISSHHLKYPDFVKQRAKEYNLVAAGGIMYNQQQIFVVYFMPKPEGGVQWFDAEKSVMEVRFFLVKKLIQVYYQESRLDACGAKCWPSEGTHRVFKLLEFWGL